MCRHVPLLAPHFRLPCVALTPSCRRYAYYLPPPRAGLVGEQERGGVRRRTGDSARSERDDAMRHVTAADLSAVLRPLAGVPRDFSALGRGLPKGKAVAETTLHVSEATEVALEHVLEGGAEGGGAEGGGATRIRAIRIDLVGDRFLRKQA